MSRPARYWIASTATAIVVTGLALLAGRDHPAEVGFACLLGAAVQAPLGWLVVGRIGRPELMLVWGGGMAARLAVVAVTALILVPALHWAAAPVLVTLVAMLLALLAVEAVTAAAELSREHG